MNPADPRAERERAQPRRTVAAINFALLALIAAATVVYWLAFDRAVVWPVALFASWCGLVQFALRRRKLSPQAQRERRQRLENAAIGTLCALVLVAAVAIPLTKLLPL